MNNACLSLNPRVKYKWTLSGKDTFLYKFGDELVQDLFAQFNNIVNIDPNEAVNILTNIIEYTGSHFVCKQNRNYIHNQPAWWNKKCQDLKDYKYRMLNKLRLTNSKTDRDEYVNAIGEFKAYCMTRKKEYNTGKANESINISDMSNTFVCSLCPRNS